MYTLQHTQKIRSSTYNRFTQLVITYIWSVRKSHPRIHEQSLRAQATTEAGRVKHDANKVEAIAKFTRRNYGFGVT